MLSHHFTFINGIFQTCEQILPFFNLLCCLSSVCIIHADESHQPKEDKERRLKRQNCAGCWMKTGEKGDSKSNPGTPKRKISRNDEGDVKKSLLSC